MPNTNYANRALALLQWNKDTTTLPIPTTLYLGQSSTALTVGPAGGADATLVHCNVTEPTIGTNSYTRYAIAVNSTNFVLPGSPPSSGIQFQNGLTITQGPSTIGGWLAGVALVDWFLADAATAGNVWAYGPNAPNQTITAAGQAINYTAGGLVFLTD